MDKPQRIPSGRIPAAASGEFTSWQLPEVGLPEQPAVEEIVAPEPEAPEEPVVARALTARQLEDITNQAHREGRAEGHAEGYADGQREGHAAGLARGLEEGRAAAREELHRQTAQLQAVMAQLFDPIATQRDAIEAALTRLSLDIARAVLDAEPALAPERLLPVVREAVRSLPVGDRAVTVALHPAQLETLKDCAFWPPAWRLEADPAIDIGGCRVHSEHSLVDRTVELRFRQVAARLLAESELAPPPEPGLLLDDDDV